MNNPLLKRKDYKAFLDSIKAKLLDAWGDDGDFGVAIKNMTMEERDFLLQCNIKAVDDGSDDTEVMVTLKMPEI